MFIYQKFKFFVKILLTFDLLVVKYVLQILNKMFFLFCNRIFFTVKFRIDYPFTKNRKASCNDGFR